MDVPVARTSLGPLRGVRRPDGTAVFKGIRFAHTRRFEPPEPVTAPWSDELAADTYGPRCPQVGGVLERMLGASKLPAHEDCTMLNVFTPACDDARRPVLVWVHGGAFNTGTGSMPWYEGSSLAQRGDVVVVALSYRLGAFGFTHLDDLTGADLDTGNLGLLDQLAALEWVRDHIASFGGDPGRVTVFGESAGGASVVALLASPLSEGLVHGAIAMSPSIPQLRTRERADEATEALLGAAGVADVEALRQLPTDDLLAAQATLLADRAGAFTAFAPTPGGRALPDHPAPAAARSTVPLVIGTTRDEMLLFTAFDPTYQHLDRAGARRRVESRLGDVADEALAAYEALRPGATPAQLVAALQTDETFRAPAWTLADRRAAAGAPTWMYWFTWASPAFDGALGSCHGLDIPFAFHNLARPGVEAFTGSGDDRAAVADAFADAVLAFARTGDPGWPAYDTIDRPTWRIDAEPELLHDPEGELRALWAGTRVGG